MGKKKELEKEKNVSDLLRNQIQKRNEIPIHNKNKNIMQDLIVRAETAEHRVHELSFLNDKKNKKSLQFELDEAKNKIKSLEEMLKHHESELVEALTQKLQESEIECNRLQQETEEKLSFAKYLMTTKEQRLEAE